MIFGKEDIEEIIGRKLLDWEYEVITKYIIAFRNKEKFKVFWGRHQGKTKLKNDAFVLNGVLPQNVIFEEVYEEEDHIWKKIQ